MFETIKGIIGDIAAGAIKDQRILLSQEQLIALDLKLREALSENERLSQRLKELERLVAERQRQIDQLNKATQPARDLPEESEKMLVIFANSS
jgi:superfamily II RNA helicase